MVQSILHSHAHVARWPLVAVLIFCFAGLTPVAAQTLWPSVAADPARDKIEEALNESTQLEFIETPLQDVVDFLKDLHRIEIQLDQRPMDAAGIGSDTPLTRNLKGIPLRHALSLMLDEVKLTSTFHNGVLMVTTPEAAKQYVSVQVYDVDELLVMRGEPEDLLKLLRDMLGKTEDDRQSIGMFGDLLVVSDDYEGHRRVRRLLAQLAKGLGVKIEAAAKGEKAADVKPAPQPAIRRVPVRDPFAPPPVKEDPFGAADPFGGGERDPFGAGDPFGRGEIKEDPFAPQATPMPDTEEDPFAPVRDPFGLGWETLECRVRGSLCARARSVWGLESSGVELFSQCQMPACQKPAMPEASVARS